MNQFELNVLLQRRKDARNQWLTIIRKMSCAEFNRQREKLVEAEKAALKNIDEIEKQFLKGF
jgi:hypothetical protein